MSDDPHPPSATTATKAQDASKPGANRGPKKNNRTPSNGNGPTNAPSGGNSGGGPNAKNSRSNSNAKRSISNPNNNHNTNNSVSGIAPARVSSAPGDQISRPSSTNPSESGSRKEGGKGRGNPRHKKGRQASNSSSANANTNGANAPPAKANGVPDPSSTALSSLQRVITDLKSISPTNPAPIHNPSASQGSINMNAPRSNAPSSNLPVNAPPFQPGGHRKSASSGNGPQQLFNPPTSNQYSSPLAGYSNQLGAMQEDAEEGHFGQDDDLYHEQPGFSQPAPAGFNAPRGRNDPPLSPMGSFTAPRFAALAQQQQQQVENDLAGPTGRPQLAPGFMFGAAGRRRASVQTDDGDSNFQFPPQPQYDPPSVAQQQQQQQQHRRQSSEVQPGMSNLMAEQIALQNQIEALQQQQQALLQQQMASNQVMSNVFGAAPSLGLRNPNGHRRIQSTQVPTMGGMGNFNAAGPFGGGAGFGGQMPVPNFGAGLGIGGLDQAGMPRGHGRRHSVNVINKQSMDAGSSFGGFGSADGFDDGFSAPQLGGAGGHSRQASRADSSWRMNNGPQNPQNPMADLAQAQAQLQSLQQFRAAAGGHHQKMPSFSFPNMLPNMMAANMLGIGGYNLLQQQQQQFQLQLQQQSNAPQRKSLFAPYLPQASLPPLLAAGKLVVGILRVNKRNRSDAYVATEVLDADIYICGSKDRNRALEGDIVAVELLDVDDVWGTKKEKEEKKRKKEENAAYDSRGGSAANARKNDKKKDDVEVEGQGLMLFEDEEVTDEVKPQFAGHVVAVVERMPGQLFSGTLGLLRPSSAATKEKQEAERREREGDRYQGDDSIKTPERPKIVWFKPTDKRVPLIAIPTEQAPEDFVTNSDAYADRLFVACIKRHPISSLHPFGTLVEELGPIGNVEVETSALLKDCNFPTEEFTDNVIKCIPPIPWTIPEREYEVRRDLRTERIFTIDPDTAKDLDDAVSVKPNGDGTFDVGVHIADVSFFVKPNTPLDRDARKRATSVYLVQRAVPMLPPTLSEELCSLIPGEERLAFSVVFTMTEDARVIKKWFGRTIIKSAAKLSYGAAQKAIEGQALGDVGVLEGHNKSDVESDIRTLHKLAKQLLNRRLENGTLRTDSSRLRFDLDESGAPTDCTPYTRQDANSLIEEFMLLANMSVAQQIAAHLPEQALLRRHEDPIDRRLAAFASRAERMGFKLDVSSAGALQRTLAAIPDPDARRILEILSTKAMHRAKYFCAGMLDIAKYSHYALNTPLYTHFTSPIRRYADIIVHRQLESVLASPTGTDPKFPMDRDSVAKVTQQCNIKKDSAKLAQEQSAHLFLCLLIADLTQRYGPVVRQARVIGVLDAAFDVLVPEFGIEKRVHVDQMPIENHVYDEHSHTLQIYWSKRDVITWLAENSDDEHLKKVKQTAEQHALKMEVASRSVHDENALFEEDDEEGDEDEVVLKRVEATRPAEDSVKQESSKQRALSAAKQAPTFEGLRTLAAGHQVQDIQELMTVPVIVTADLTKSPPVIKVYSVNPYAEPQASQKK